MRLLVRESVRSTPEQPLWVCHAFLRGRPVACCTGPTPQAAKRQTLERVAALQREARERLFSRMAASFEEGE